MQVSGGFWRADAGVKQRAFARLIRIAGILGAPCLDSETWVTSIPSALVSKKNRIPGLKIQTWGTHPQWFIETRATRPKCLLLYNFRIGH